MIISPEADKGRGSEGSLAVVAAVAGGAACNHAPSALLAPSALSGTKIKQWITLSINQIKPNE